MILLEPKSIVTIIYKLEYRTKPKEMTLLFQFYALLLYYY